MQVFVVGTFFCMFLQHITQEEIQRRCKYSDTDSNEAFRTFFVYKSETAFRKLEDTEVHGNMFEGFV